MISRSSGRDTTPASIRITPTDARITTVVA